MRNMSELGDAAEAVVVLVTVPNAEVAAKLAEALVGEELAACVNVLPEVASTYRWQGKVERDREQLCIIKTTMSGFEVLRARVVALHPYEVPEVVALPIVAGHAPYLAWIAASVRGRAG
jgi:periplasmic divalent cation tolerance protein